MTDTTSDEATGTVSGGVKTLLRLEGLTLLAGMTALYVFWAGPWWLYAVLFFAPDLSFVAYLAGPKIGAWAYNAMHTTIVPLAMLTVGFGFAPAVGALARSDLAGAYRVRPRARLWAEIFGRIWLHPSGPDRPGSREGLRCVRTPRSPGVIARLDRAIYVFTLMRIELTATAVCSLSPARCADLSPWEREPAERDRHFSPTLNGGSLPGGTVSSAIASTIATIT